MSWLRDTYQPGLRVRRDREAAPSGRDNRAAQVQAETARDLARQLGLDPARIDTSNPAVLKALGAVRFLRYSTGTDRGKAMQKVLDLRDSDPELAGRLHAMAAEIASQPQWHYDKMTPEELQHARKALDEAEAGLKEIEKPIRPLIGIISKPAEYIDHLFYQPVKEWSIRDERRRLDAEIARRRDPRDR